MNDKINVDFMRENKDSIKKYFEMICDASGKVNFFRHKMYLKNKEPKALLCQKIVDDNNIRMAELKYFVVDKDLEDLHLYCETCGKRVKNLLADRRFCCQKCRGQSEEAKEKTRETRRIEKEKITAIKNENAKTELDIEMKSLKANEQLLRNYIAEITDSYNGPNISTHYMRIRNGDEVAKQVEKLMAEYDIKLVDLKVILDKNFNDIHFFCPSCGKRITDLRRSFCSVKCSSNAASVRKQYFDTCISRYGTDAKWQNPNPKIKYDENILKTITPTYLNVIERRVLNYLDSVKDQDGDYNISMHRKNLRNEEPEAVFIETVLFKYNMCIPELAYWSEKNFAEKELYCAECGKRLTDIRSKYCSKKCAPNYFHTKAEDEIADFIISLFDKPINVVYNERKVIGPLEIDIYFPDFKIGIEYDGILWHSTNFMDKDPNYHKDKTDRCESKGVSLLHIYENEWKYKQDIVKSILRSRFGVFENTYYARECKVESISSADYKDFLTNNHIQGYTYAETRLGLINKNSELVSCIGIGESRFTKGEKEVIRFCNAKNTKVLGGLSKLISHSNENRLFSYVDRRFFNGSGYEKAGFKLIGKTSPSYVYVKNNEVLSRFQCQKQNLPGILGEKFDPDLTQYENMKRAKYCQVYDCGNLKYLYTA